MTQGFEGMLREEHSPGCGKFLLNTSEYVCVCLCLCLGGRQGDHRELPSATVHLLHLTVWEDIPCAAIHTGEVQEG